MHEPAQSDPGDWSPAASRSHLRSMCASPGPCNLQDYVEGGGERGKAAARFKAVLHGTTARDDIGTPALEVRLGNPRVPPATAAQHLQPAPRSRYRHTHWYTHQGTGTPTKVLAHPRAATGTPITRYWHTHCQLRATHHERQWRTHSGWCTHWYTRTRTPTTSN
jgi:hypothetical protein